MIEYSFLIVEDKKTHAREYETIISTITVEINAGCNIDTAYNYKDALEKIMKTQYDVIILDRKLMDKDGESLIKDIFQKRPFQRLIFITAFPVKGLKERMYRFKIFAYVEKEGDYREKLKYEINNILTKGIHCFLIIPYKKKYLKFYNELIRPYLEYLGFKPILAEDIFNKDTIIDKVREGIDKANFVIADLSKKNANVFYETGLCHQKGLPTILITHNPKIIPSDLKGRYYFVYKGKKTDSFKKDLIKRIQSINAEFLKSRR